MATRAATATIKGYYYQFDTCINNILDLDEVSSITIEGIEDIDIETATDKTAIQCKYLSKPKFINSAVREPITLMLEHFINPVSPVIKYVLYAHFEDETAGDEKVIDLTTLKQILTYTEKKISKAYHVDNGITDLQLNNFLARFKMIFAKEFEVQQKEIITKIKKRFSCTELVADTFYYNNSLRIVIDKARMPNAVDRVVTKSFFDGMVNNKKKLFNEWYIALRSRQQYFKSISKVLSDTGVKNSSRSKYVFIGGNILKNDNAELPLSVMIKNLIGKYFRLNYSLRNAVPITFVVDCDANEMKQLKIDLINSEIGYNDGHEDVQFHSVSFNSPPILNVTRDSTRIAKSSYLVRLLKLETFEREKGNLAIPGVVLNFSDKDCPFDMAGTYQFFDIKYCESLKEIQTILN